ncbi:MAG: hypothetical protein K8M05_17400, partial [Deltaproteobacteria bacterium]|nr:hypothetical protein [Kofleriaceae bacterium]
MRATVVVVVVVTALGAAASCARERAPALVDQVARVEDASVLAADSIPLPPRLVMLDSDGTVRVADAPRDA